MTLTKYRKIVKSLLKEFGMYSESAEKLVCMTAAHESGIFKYRRQLGVNPDGNVGGFGLGQVELNTENDLYQNYIKYRSGILHNIMSSYFPECIYLNISTTEFIETKYYQKKREILRYCDEYNALMIRLCYRRQAEALPQPDDEVGLARYWKKYYNTELGKGTVEKFLKDWDIAQQQEFKDKIEDF